MTISKVYGENCHSLFRPCTSACRVSSRPRYFQRLMRARKQTALMNGPILKTEIFVNAEQTCRVVIRTQRDWRRVNDVLTQGDSASPICITKAANCSTTAILTRHSNLWWQTTQISLVYSLVFMCHKRAPGQVYSNKVVNKTHLWGFEKHNLN